MTHVWQRLAVGVMAAMLAAPAALADDCIESLTKVPMMSPLAAGPAGGPPRRASLSAPVPGPRLAMARLSPPKPTRPARAHARKASGPKAAAHRAARPAKHRFARRPTPTRVAAATPPKGFPDARLMMTRLAPPEAAPEYALIRTTTCTTGIVPGGRLMPLLVSPPGIVVPTGTFLDGEGPVIVGPYFPDDDLVQIVPPFRPPPGPPLGPPTLTPPTGAVPEPSTWALLILGFGMVGAGLRRKRLGLPLRSRTTQRR